MENTSEEDDRFSIVCGDLGLGESTRKSYLNCELLNLGHCHNTLSVSDSCLNSHLKGLNYGSDPHSISSKECGANIWERKFVSCDHSCETLLSTEPLVKTNTNTTNLGVQGMSMEVFPTYADVPYGTSLRQQKKLFEQQIDTLRRQFAASLSSDTTASGFKKQNWDTQRSNSLKLTGREIEAKLMVALEEMEELKIELDACQKRLDAKYKAVAILKQQADLADSELKTTKRRASETSKRLEQHGDGVEALFEALDHSAEGHNSKDVQKQEMDRVCQENVILMSKLETRNEELRRANAHKAAISRERDELLALLDVTERLKYEQGKSRVAEEEYSTFTSSELAVLGACKCRISSPEPCGCAHAAVHMRKEVAKLREELEVSHKRREESNLTIDAYRTAFEEQLAKSRSLSIQLSHIATLSSRTAKAKAAIKWLIHVLGDDDYVSPRPMEQGMEAEKGNNLSTMTIQEMVTVLTEMVHEKNEALAHQRLAAQVLASKLYKYEKMEGKRLEVTETGTDPKPQTHKKKRNKDIQIMQDRKSENSGTRTSEISNFYEDNSCDTFENGGEVFRYILHPLNKENLDVLDNAGIGKLDNTVKDDDNLLQMSNITNDSHTKDQQNLLADASESFDMKISHDNHTKDQKDLPADASESLDMNISHDGHTKNQQGLYADASESLDMNISHDGHTKNQQGLPADASESFDMKISHDNHTKDQKDLPADASESLDMNISHDGHTKNQQGLPADASESLDMNISHDGHTKNQQGLPADASESLDMNISHDGHTKNQQGLPADASESLDMNISHDGHTKNQQGLPADASESLDMNINHDGHTKNQQGLPADASESLDMNISHDGHTKNQQDLLADASESFDTVAGEKNNIETSNMSMDQEVEETTIASTDLADRPMKQSNNNNDHMEMFDDISSTQSIS